jgi:hypothetical protein
MEDDLVDELRLHTDDEASLKTLKFISEAADEIESLRYQLAKTTRLLRETTAELKFASIFVRSREKMHPEGLKLYDELLERLGI